MMTRLLAFLAIASISATPPCLAEQAVPTGHSTVHFVFIVPNNAAPTFGGNKPTATVGNIVVPIESIRSVSISIDGEFVGHAMLGFHDVKPVFVLSEGSHEFAFTCDGFKPYKTNMKVLGTGSKQYLLVKLPVSETGPQPEPSIDFQDPGKPGDASESR